MKKQNILTGLFLLALTIAGLSGVSKITTIESIKSQLTEGQTILRRSQNTLTPEEEDFIELFEVALEDGMNSLDDYIDITGLNVTDKDAIDLDNYDPDYVLPDIEENVTDILEDQMTNFGVDEYEAIENRRKASFNFDKYYGLFKNNLDSKKGGLKYTHPKYVNNPNSTLNQLHALLVTAGLGATAIIALEGSAVALSSATSMILFPPAAEALAGFAILAIAVVVIANWDKIQNIFYQMVSLFVQMFSFFANLIQDLFADIRNDAIASYVSSTAIIGGLDFEFKEVRADNLAMSVAIVAAAKRTPKVFLMAHIENDTFQIALGMPVTEQFCIQHKTHENGYSSYTVTQNTARRLILQAGSGYCNLTPELHLFDGTKGPKLAWKHFHNYTADGVKYGTRPQKWSHSFFGVVYYSPNSNGLGIPHPGNPLL